MNTSALFEELKSQISRYHQRFNRLVVSERDRKVLILGGIGGSLLVLYIIFQIFSSGSARLEKKAEALRQDINKIESLRTEYVESNRKIRELTKEIKTGDQDLVSLVEKALIEAEVERGNFSINSRTPSAADLYEEKMVDVELRKVSLDKAVGVLYSIQTKPTFLRVSKFNVRTRFDNANLVDVSFRVSTYEFKQEV